MALQLVSEPDYRGASGLVLLRELQRDITAALHAEDWLRVRELDRSCASLVERLIAANPDDLSILVLALSELKGVYANLIQRCQHEADAMARLAAK
jgi:flagellar protein FliT